MEKTMDRITVHEFIEEVRQDHSPLKEGHDLGLVIDDTAGDHGLMKQMLSAIATQASCVVVNIEDLCDPHALNGALDRAGVAAPLVLVHADERLLPRHHAALQSLVYHHALQATDYRHTVSEQVALPPESRFVLVMPRKELEQSWATYPLLKGILGATISCDASRKEGV